MEAIVSPELGTYMTFALVPTSERGWVCLALSGFITQFHKIGCSLFATSVNEIEAKGL
jgi:hypothetical protein